MHNIREFKDLLSSPKKIAIIPHQKPDADALGSALGLSNYFIKKGHQTHVLAPTDYPDFLIWMKGNETVINFEKDPELGIKYVNESDIICCIDFSSLKRIEKLGEIVEKSAAVKVLIDHHLEPDDFADFSFSNTKASATAEIIFDMICELGDKSLIDRDIAEELYAGIMTDTGSFHHSNTTQKVHRVAAELIELGADVTRVAKLVYDTNSLDRLRYIGFALSNSLHLISDLNAAYFSISMKDLEKFNSKTGDTEGLVNYGLSIEGIQVSAAIIERPDMIKFSFRSIGEFSVNDFARKYFNGGGHKNAAGGKLIGTLDEAVQKFKTALQEFHSHNN
jgi:phosphoesterase RecJ-like protein